MLSCVQFFWFFFYCNVDCTGAQWTDCKDYNENFHVHWLTKDFLHLMWDGIYIFFVCLSVRKALNNKSAISTPRTPLLIVSAFALVFAVDMHWICCFVLPCFDLVIQFCGHKCTLFLNHYLHSKYFRDINDNFLHTSTPRKWFV